MVIFLGSFSALRASRVLIAYGSRRVSSKEEPCCWEKCLIGTCFGPVGPCCACWGFFLLGWFFTLVFMREAGDGAKGCGERLMLPLAWKKRPIEKRFFPNSLS